MSKDNEGYVWLCIPLYIESKQGKIFSKITKNIFRLDAVVCHVKSAVWFKEWINAFTI